MDHWSTRGLQVGEAGQLYELAWPFPVSSCQTAKLRGALLHLLAGGRPTFWGLGGVTGSGGKGGSVAAAGQWWQSGRLQQWQLQRLTGRSPVWSVLSAGAWGGLQRGKVAHLQG